MAESGGTVSNREAARRTLAASLGLPLDHLYDHARLDVLPIDSLRLVEAMVELEEGGAFIDEALAMRARTVGELLSGAFQLPPDCR